MKLGNDGVRRADRRQQREPGYGVEAREARFDHGRQVGGRGRTRERSDRKRAHLAFATERERGGGTGEHHGQATAEQVGHHRGDAAVGDMLDIEAGHGLVHLAGEMLRGADAGGAKGELPGGGRASAVRSATLFAVTSLLTTRTLAVKQSCVIGAKSLTASNGSFGSRLRLVKRMP